MIKIIFSDIDGCIGDFVKPKFPLKQDLEGNEDSLNKIKERTKIFNNVLFGVATARSYHHADNIMRAANHLGPSIFEGGNVIYEPGEGIYFLFEKHPKFAAYVDQISGFVDWRNDMEAFERNIKMKFPDANVRQMKDRTCMLTYEFDKDVGKELYGEIRDMMPDMVKKAIGENVLKVMFCSMAIDILPNTSKGEAVKFLMDKYNINKDEALAIGDSSHSDIDLLDAVGNVACPSNADEKLKLYVKGRNGFIASGNSGQGFLEILNHFGVSSSKIKDNIDKFSEKSVLVLGDFCLDEYLYGNASSLAPEAPILRLVIEDKVITAGAAGNVAFGVKALGAKVYATGVIGQDENSNELINKMHENGIDTIGMIFQKGRVTSKYSRIAVGDKHFPKQKIVRFDTENKESVNEGTIQKIVDFVKSKSGKIDAIIVADYDEVGRGIVQPDLLKEIRNIAEDNGIILIGDSRKNISDFRGFTSVVPNIFETELAYGRKIGSIKDAAESLIKNLELKSILITKDKEGMEVCTSDGEYAVIPSYATRIVDVCGAGDTVTCTFTLGLCSGLSFIDSARLASYAASISVAKEGTATVSKDELKDYIK